MNVFIELFPQNTERLGWAVIHSLWQGAIAAAVLGLVLRSLRDRSAAARHAVCLVTMLALLVAAIVTALVIAPRTVPRNFRGVASELSAPMPMDAASVSASAAAATFADDRESTRISATMLPMPVGLTWREQLAPMLPWIAGVWMVGVALLSLRHFVGWRNLRAMRRSGVNARSELQRKFVALLAKFGRNAAVGLLESGEAAVPMLAGLLKPAVLLPVRVITGLGEREIEAILAHELAHLVRRDAWSNLAQVAIETLLFYHPAVWWIGRCARQERENAADDLALEVCADRRVYAGALAHLAEMHLGQQAALAANGGSLLARIRRIVRPVPVETSASGWSLGIPAMLAALGLAAIFRTQAEQVKPLDAAPNSDAKKVAQETTAEAEARIEAAFQSVLAHSSNWAASADAILQMPTFATRNTGAALEAEPVVGPDSYTIELSLVPQAVEFEGFINYGSPITTASPTFNATSFHVGPGQTVLIGGLVREGDNWKTISVVAENKADAKAAEEAPHKADDAKTWIADVFQLEDKAKREAAIERIRTAMTSGSANDARAGVTAFVQLGPIEFDKASFRPAVRALLASEDAKTRAAAASAFTMTGADPDDLPHIFALADDPAPEVRDGLTYVIVSLTKHDVRDKAASDAILKLMANLPRDSRSVAHAMWGVKLSPEIEAKVLEFCRGIDQASNGSVGYNFFYGTLSTQANKSEASCKRLIELLAHPDTTNIAGRSAWGLQQGVDRPHCPLVADAMMKVIEVRSDGYLRNNALSCLREYGNAAQAPALKALLEKPGVTGDLRKTLEETLAVIGARPAAHQFGLGATADHAEGFAESPRDIAADVLQNANTIVRAGSPVDTPTIEVEWNGKWWPASVIEEKDDKTQIHYVGYGKEWDEWVTKERIRSLTPPTHETPRFNVEEEIKKSAVARLVERNRQAARLRAADDRQRYSVEQLQEIETLYQVANTKGKRDPEAKEKLKLLLEKYDKANRTGCATLYLGQASEGAERLEYLTRAVEKFSDCYYFNGCQVGGYGRYVLALTLWENGEKDKAKALFAELKTTFKDTTDHRGRPMIEAVEAAEKELAAKQ